MTEEELLKAQSDLIMAQQRFISALTGKGSPMQRDETAPSWTVSHAGECDGGKQKKGITLAEYAQTFMESRANTVKQSTYHNYAWLLKNYILPQIGDVELQMIDNRCLQGFADVQLRTHAKKTVRDLVGLVKSILNDAYINEVAEFRKFIIRYPQSECAENRVLSEEEFRVFEEYLMTHVKPHDIGELIMLETGMRIGEMCGLKWEDIDKEGRTIHVKRTVQRIYKQEQTSEIHIGNTKTAAGERTIPISARVSRHLEAHRRDDEIYVASGKETPTEPRTHRQYHKRLMEKIGIKYINPHGLRHTFATRAIQHNVDPKTVSAILGHKNSNITLNVYTSVTEEMLRSGISKLEGKEEIENV